MLVCQLVLQVDPCRSILLVSLGPRVIYVLGRLQSNAIEMPLSEAPQRSCDCRNESEKAHRQVCLCNALLVDLGIDGKPPLLMGWQSATRWRSMVAPYPEGPPLTPRLLTMNPFPDKPPAMTQQSSISINAGARITSLRPETAKKLHDGYATIVICVRRSSGLNAGLKLDT